DGEPREGEGVRVDPHRRKGFHDGPEEVPAGVSDFSGYHDDLSEAGPRKRGLRHLRHAEAAFLSFFASRWTTPSAVRQARLRRDQITTKTISKQSEHQRGREATRDQCPRFLLR